MRHCSITQAVDLFNVVGVAPDSVVFLPLHIQGYTDAPCKIGVRRMKRPEAKIFADRQALAGPDPHRSPSNRHCNQRCQTTVKSNLGDSAQ